MLTSARARLISQTVGSPQNNNSRDFASSFKCATRDTGFPQFATSHKSHSEPRRKPTIPAYPSLIQSLRWNPHVEISSANNSQTSLEDNPKFNCHCQNCVGRNCPSRVSSSNTIKPAGFKDNIMTFSDRFTMTPRLNDACCGVCTPITTTPKTSDVCVPSDMAVRDAGSIVNFPMYTQPMPMPILKKQDCGRAPGEYGYCGHATGHVPVEIHHEAVRDTDICDDYCEPIKPKSLKAFMKFKKKHQNHSSQYLPEYGRNIIYNEGISDVIANNCPMPPRNPSPMNVQRDSKISIRSHIRCYKKYDPIPFAHKSDSRYHNSCKKPDFTPKYYMTDVDVVKHVAGSPRVVHKTIISKPGKEFGTPSISLPRKVLTSEANIDNYIDKGRVTMDNKTRMKSKK